MAVAVAVAAGLRHHALNTCRARTPGESAARRPPIGTLRSKITLVPKLYAGCGGVSRGAVGQVDTITAKLEGIKGPVH